MIQRCTNPKRLSFHNYGGRGITVCERWRKFENFLADMGERPAGLTLDRSDNNGNYEPGNCCWRTVAEQSQNTRRTILNPALVADIRALAAQGLGYRRIARAMGLRASTVQPVVIGKSWRGIGMPDKAA